jgi:hypothetical protein
MPTNYIQFGHIKFEKISEKLGLQSRAGGQKRTGALTDHICRICGIELDSTDRATLLRQIQEAWKKSGTETNSISGPQFNLLRKGLGLTDESLEWFLSSEMEVFNRGLDQHALPQDYHEMFARNYVLQSARPEHHLSEDLASMDVFSSSQKGYEFPIMKLFLELVRIPEQSLNYGFQTILIDFEFGDGSVVTMSQRLGDRNRPSGLESNAKIYARRTDHNPRFEVVSNDKHHPLNMDEYTPFLGQLRGLKPGDTFKVRARAELRSDIMQKENGTGASDPALAEVQKLVIRKQLKRAAGLQNLRLTSDGQFIILVSQEVTLVEDDPV